VNELIPLLWTFWGGILERWSKERIGDAIGNNCQIVLPWTPIFQPSKHDTNPTQAIKQSSSTSHDSISLGYPALACQYRLFLPFQASTACPPLHIPTRKHHHPSRFSTCNKTRNHFPFSHNCWWLPIICKRMLHSMEGFLGIAMGLVCWWLIWGFCVADWMFSGQSSAVIPSFFIIFSFMFMHSSEVKWEDISRGLGCSQQDKRLRNCLLIFKTSTGESISGIRFMLFWLGIGNLKFEDELEELV